MTYVQLVSHLLFLVLMDRSVFVQLPSLKVELLVHVLQILFLILAQTLV